MKYVYSAILYPDDGKIGVTIPDLPGCHTYGDDRADAMLMAKDAMEMWLWNAENTAMPIPSASENLPITEPGGTLTLIVADTDEYRQAHDTRAIKKTLSIPQFVAPHMGRVD
jgi:predicted RNase H-like HicB family nuclease